MRQHWRAKYRVLVFTSDGFMTPQKVTRETLSALPNIGTAAVKDLSLLGIYGSEQVVAKCSYDESEKSISLVFWMYLFGSHDL